MDSDWGDHRGPLICLFTVVVKAGASRTLGVWLEWACCHEVRPWGVEFGVVYGYDLAYVYFGTEIHCSRVEWRCFLVWLVCTGTGAVHFADGGGCCRHFVRVLIWGRRMFIGRAGSRGFGCFHYCPEGCQVLRTRAAIGRGVMFIGWARSRGVVCFHYCSEGCHVLRACVSLA